MKEENVYNETGVEDIDERKEEDFRPVACPHCGMDLDEHEGDGFCPPGTEEAGGRR